jgi:uncharacterized damage-inducible protein DinB
MATKDEKAQLVKHLKGGEAFASLEDFIDKIPFEKLGERPHNIPYSFYELFFHIVAAQKDILEFSVSEGYKASNWPDDYWLDTKAPKSKKAWTDLKTAYFEDRRVFAAFILDPKNDLNTPVKNSENQTVLREALLVVEHTAYHTDQMLIILRLLGLYK